MIVYVGITLMLYVLLIVKAILSVGQQTCVGYVLDRYLVLYLQFDTFYFPM